MLFCLQSRFWDFCSKFRRDNQKLYFLCKATSRHTRRILAAYRERGAAALAHGHRGRRPVNATPEALVVDVAQLARTRYAGVNHTHLAELLAEREGIHIGRTTLRRVLLDAGLSSPRRRRPPKHRVRRQRMPRAGMLIQLDGSYHRWLGDHSPPFTLLLAVDDATGSVVDALFCNHEDSHNYFLLMQNLLRRRGIPLALYTDRHAVLQAHARIRVDRNAHPVRTGHGRTGYPDDIRLVAPGQRTGGTCRGNLPGPADHGTPAGRSNHH